MDISQSARSAKFGRQILEFMDEHIYPNERRFYQEAERLGPWTVQPVVEELKPQARKSGLVELFLPADAHGRPDQPRICAAYARSWAARISRRKCSTAPRPTPATWKCSRYGTRGAEGALAEAFARGRNPIRIRDDRAGGRLVATPPTSKARSCGTVTITSSTAASGTPPARPIRAARSSFSWARPTRQPGPASSQSMILVPKDTPGVTRHAGAACFRLLWRARPGIGGRLQQCARSGRQHAAWARAAGSRSRRGGWARDGSITACA